MSQPSAFTCQHLAAELERLGLAARLGADLFAATNWHQSLSDRFPDEPGSIEQLRKAGDKLSARAVRFTIERIESQSGPDGAHWAFRPKRTPADFTTLLENLGRAITATTGRQAIRPKAHITISYWARDRLNRMVPIHPIDWMLDEVLLVRGGGQPYHYEIIDRWKLEPPRLDPTAEQLPLF